MKKIILILFFLPSLLRGQNVGIGTPTPLARLEVRDTAKTKVSINSKNFLDTTQLIFSNRTAANLGTDMIMSANGERGIRISSLSDLTANTHDSIIALTPQGRVGINNASPTERLDVRGNMNITGTIKANGNSGAPNQVLMQDGLGNLAWGNLSQYKNFESYTAPGSGTWTVPAGVTNILVELTGGGSGGIVDGGGGGGGYVIAQFDVTPGTTLSYSVGAGSAGAAGGSSLNAGNTTFTAGAVNITAQGGLATSFTVATKSFVSSGGSFSITPATFRNFLGISGAAGKPNRITFQQKSATSFFEISSDGDGGGPGYCRSCTGKGTYYAYDIAAAAVYRQAGDEFRIPTGAGGGGGWSLSSVGGFGGGGAGRDGILIIHY